jgi:putative ABC transport system ATP-binding protein
MLMNAASPVIVNNLTFSYAYDEPDSNVLNSISLSVSSGELIILTGASGSGKTTLLTLVGGLKTGTGGISKLGFELGLMEIGRAHV